MNGILVLLALALVASTTQETNEEVLLTVGSEEVTVGEFETVFQKNNSIEEVSKEELAVPEQYCPPVVIILNG